jgi:RNAse (barnase) inhibitor barstar
MAESFVWFTREFPWLRSGMVHAVDISSAAEFEGSLKELGFTVARLQCGEGDDIFRELSRALDFPSYFGGSGWDAVSDCLGDIKVDQRFALFWYGADSYAGAHSITFGEACVILTEFFRSLGSSDIQAELVLVGIGTEFPQRSPTSSSDIPAR